MKKNKIKAIAFDMDGTLLTDAKEISQRTRRCFEALEARGISLILSTGRSFEALESYKRNLALDHPVICYNGAGIISKEGNVIREHLIKDDVSRAVIKYARKQGIHAQVYRKGKLFFEKRTPEAEFYENHINLIGEVVNLNQFDPPDITKIMYLGEHDYLTKLGEKMRYEYGQDLSVMFSNPIFLEFMAAKVSKGNALAELAEYLEIGLENIMAFGDGGNDISMIKSAGIGIAMSNAAPEVQSAADIVTLSNNNDGVAEVLEDFFGLN